MYTITKNLIQYNMKSIIQTYTQSELSFKCIMYAYMCLGAISFLIADYIYFMFAWVLICLVYYGERKRQECVFARAKIKLLQSLLKHQGTPDGIQTTKR